MSEPESVEQKVKEIISRVLKVPLPKIQMHSRFRDDLGSDSLDLILLLYELEDQLGMKLSDDEAKAILTVGDAVRLATQVTQK